MGLFRKKKRLDDGFIDMVRAHDNGEEWAQKLEETLQQCERPARRYRKIHRRARCNEKRHDRVGSLELGTSDRT